jgi:hypothetical protein
VKLYYNKQHKQPKQPKHKPNPQQPNENKMDVDIEQSFSINNPFNVLDVEVM